jgi:hypothetical protein
MHREWYLAGSGSTLIVKIDTKERMVAMKSELIIALFTILRLGIPMVIMILFGEAIRRHDLNIHKPRGA